jgi:outer membrane immunogenic protein
MTKTAFAALAVSAGIVFGATAAQAADPYVDPAYDWNGAYIGLLGTYGWADSHHCDGTCPNNPTSGSGPDVSSDGFGLGLELGYNHVWNSVLVGIAADYSFTDIDGSSPSQAAPAYACGTGCDTDVHGIGTARIRLGLPMNNLLPYLTGGLAISDVQGRLDGDGSSKTFFNATAGFGLEYGVSQNFTVKAEYLHIFDNGKRFVFNPADCAAPGCGLNEYSADLVRLGLNWKF